MRILYTFLIIATLLFSTVVFVANVYATAQVDHMRITVYYTPGVDLTSGGTTMMMGMEF